MRLLVATNGLAPNTRRLPMSEKQLYVKRDGRVPQDVVEIVERTPAEVAFFPTGGGPQYRMPAGTFDSTHREVSAAEFDTPRAYAATFDIDGMFGDLPGYSLGHRWNGWACPYFPKESCDRIVHVVGKGARYDEASESYIIPYDDGSEQPTEFDSYASHTIAVDDKELKVWAIGNGCWTWQERR
jgi:hypothetical protein